MRKHFELNDNKIINLKLLVTEVWIKLLIFVQEVRRIEEEEKV